MSLSLAPRIIDLPSSGIHAIMAYASKYSDVISLGQGTPYFPTPEFIYKGLIDRAAHDSRVGMYAGTPIENELKLLIADRFAHHYGFTPELSQLIITVGGVAALTIALLSIITPGDEVIYFDPSYPIHLSQIHFAEGKPHFVSYREDNKWRFPIEALPKAINSKTKAIILTNPNNPTGTILTKDEVTALSEIVLNNNMYLILDEAYDYLHYETDLYSPLKNPELREHIILAKSFSKEYAMTGWRIGYAYAPQHMCDTLKWLHTYVNIAAPTPAIVAGIIAMKDPRGDAFIKETQQMYNESKSAICQRLAKLPDMFSFVPPQGAYYVFPKILPSIEAHELAISLIDEARVVTIPGDSMGPAGKNHLRMSFSLPANKIHDAFDRIDAFAKKHGFT